MRPIFKTAKYEKMKLEDRYAYAFTLFDFRLKLENCIAVCEGLHKRTYLPESYTLSSEEQAKLKQIYTKDLTLDVSEISYGLEAHFTSKPVFPDKGNPYIAAELTVDGRKYQGDKVLNKLKKYRENLIDYQTDMHNLGDGHREDSRVNRLSYR